MSKHFVDSSDLTKTKNLLFPCTLGTLVANVQGMVPHVEFKSLKSAATVAAKRVNKDANTWMVTSSKELTEAINGIHPLRHKINEGYLRVIRARVNRVLRLNGIVFLSGHCGTEVPAASQEMVEAARRIDEIRLRCLMPFIRFMIRCGRRLDDTTQADFEAYCVEVDETSQRKNKLGSKQCAHREWNYFAKRVDAWPKVLFALKSKRDDYLLSETDMPAAIADFDAMQGVPFRGNRRFRKRRRSLSDETVKSRRYTFRRIISAAVGGGIDPARLKSMADACNIEVLEAAYNFILDRNDERVDGTCDVCRLARLMLAVAEQWVGVTGQELEAHKQLYEDFEHIQQGMAEKNHRLLAAFSSDAAISAFLKTPKRVMDRYSGITELNERDCVQMQMATAMAILTRVLIRMENLKQIEDGKHLIESGWGADRNVLLIFGEKEVKNDEYLETLLSPRVVAILDTYRERAWSTLKRGKTQFLFPGYGGKHKSASTFGPQLAEFVWRETDIRVTPHQFRHLGGYFHLLRYPGDYASVQKMLGHRKIETTIKYYTGTMDRRAAFAKYDEHIEARIEESEQAETANKKVRIKSNA